MTMLQIINISDSILYSQSKVENQFLGLINACVSHEMRNPLNSIIAQNIQKKFLYSKLVGIVKKGEMSKQVKNSLQKVMDELSEGLKI